MTKCYQLTSLPFKGLINAVAITEIKLKQNKCKTMFSFTEIVLFQFFFICNHCLTLALLDCVEALPNLHDIQWLKLSKVVCVGGVFDIVRPCSDVILSAISW